MKFLRFCFLVALWAFCASAFGDVWTAPAPEGQGVEGAYRVTVDGKDVAIYRSFDQEKDSGEYYFGTFEFTGTVKIEVTAPFSLAKATVAPERFGVKFVERSEKSATLEASEPFLISLEPNGRVKPLILFGLAPEKDAPKEGDANVVYFGPGVHKPDVVNLTDNQTLYVAAGAVLNAGVVAKGKNISIRGRGIIAGTEWKRHAGPSSFPIHCQDCENLEIRDVVLRDPWSWTCVLNNCRGVKIDGLRICASNMLNDDALDLCNASDVEVTNCFFRSQDDSIAIKGLRDDLAPCENIVVKDCVFWTDRANIFRIGYECQAKTMRDIVAENIDVLYYSVDYRDHDQYWANAIIWLQPNLEMPMEQCRFSNFRIRSTGDKMIMLMAKAMQCKYGKFENPTPGRLFDCSLSDFVVYGEKGEFGGELYFAGFSETSDVKNISITNFDYFGEKITKDSDAVVIGQFAQGIEIQ